MSRRGRPPKGAEHVEELQGSPQAKERLKLILQTLSKEVSVEEACARLGLSATRFHQLRDEALAAAAMALEPRVKGRPAAPEPTLEAREVEQLRTQVQQLSLDLHMAMVREEIRMVMPRLLQAEAEELKKTLYRLIHPPRGAWQDTTKSTRPNSTPSTGTST
jgi:transposase-like protein